MPLTEAYLKSLHDRTKGGPSPSVIDRKCRKCGYSLKGLPQGGVCPECGTPFKAARAGRFHDNLTDAPLGYLSTLRTGLGVLGAAVGVIILGLIASLFFGFGAVAGTAILVGALWLTGVWITTTPRPKEDTFAPDPLLDSGRLTNACRALHGAMPLAGLLVAGVWATFTGTPMSMETRVLLIGSGVLYLVAALALIPFGVYLSALSDWADHDSLGAQFRVAVFLIVVATLLGVLSMISAAVSTNVRGLAALTTMWASIILILTAAFFLVLILRLAHSAHWAVLNSIEALESEARVVERKKLEAMRITEPQRTARATREGHGGSWRDTGFLALDDDPQ